MIQIILFANFKGYFTLESGSSLIPKKYWLGNRKDYDKDTRLANPQLFMQQGLEKLMYDIAKYILTSYELFEE